MFFVLRASGLANLGIKKGKDRFLGAEKGVGMWKDQRKEVGVGIET